MKKLDVKDLYNDKFVKEFKFSTTAELAYNKKIIGQDKGVEAIKFGLNVKDYGYNIYIAGDMGTGKTTSAKLLCQEISRNENVAPDFIYVYNFENDKEPILISVPTGVGSEIKQDLEKLIEIFDDVIPKAFADKDLTDIKNELLAQFEEEKDILLKELQEDIKRDDFTLKHSSTGIYIMPLKDGEEISEEEYEDLTEDEKDLIRENSITTNIKVENTVDLIKAKEKEIVKNIDDIDSNEMSKIIKKYFLKIARKYKKLDIEKLNKYFDGIKKDLLENYQEFLPIEQLGEDNLQELLANSQKSSNDFKNRYTINLFVDNKDETCAKVINVDNPTFYNLFGEIECDNEGNAITTDFTRIKSGAIQKAYGGYVIINCYDLLTNPGCYEKLRQILKTKKVTVDAQTQVNNAITYSLIKPEYMDFDTKIILVGSVENYYNISSYDDDFRKYFKVFSDFDIEMDNDEKNRYEIVNFILGFVSNKESYDFTKDAVVEIIKFSQRLSGSENSLNTNFNLLTEFLVECNLVKSEDESKYIEQKHVLDAIRRRNNRHNNYEQRMLKLIDDEVIMVDTEGESVGQINGLCVISTYDYSFGIPTRITATTYIGSEGIINIEKEADMSGNIHEKGVGVLSGYLGEKYSQEFPLCLSARICFEQNYSGVDGDSASSTELYAILSSLSGYPINQSIAVTGSINQKGSIQAIGGVSEKVEGFFKLCKKRGLTGKHGVIIPKQNVVDLVLNYEVTKAIEDGLFNIFAISDINEGMEILTGQKMGELIGGKYEKDTINYRVYEKLKDYFIKLNDVKRKGKND